MRRSGSYFPVWTFETTAVDCHVSGVIPGARVSPKLISFLEVGKNAYLEHSEKMFLSDVFPW